MSSYLGVYFDPLPTLQEDDELVPLSTILTLSRGSLREFEVWAVCRECCLALRSISKSSVDLFKKLCLTPDTLTFNAAGSVSFSDSDAVDKDYQPPEFFRDGNSFKGHIYSLARTLLEASAHDLPEGVSLEISTHLLGLLTRMSLDDPVRRPTLEEVTVTCNRELGEDPGSSKSVCRTLSSIGRRKLSLDSQYEFPLSGSRRKSSSSEASRLASIKSDIPEDSNNDDDVPETRHHHQESSTTDHTPSEEMKASSRPGASRVPDKDLPPSSLSNGRTHDLHSKQTMSDHASKLLRELPSPAALNNLSQRAQDILKKLYSAGEQQGYIDRKNRTGVNSKDAPNITVLSSSLPETQSRKNKAVPRPEEITARLKDLAKERGTSGEDAEVAQACERESSPEELKIRKVLDKIPRSDDIRTESPLGRRSCSPGRVSSPRGRKSPHNSSRDKLSPVDKRTSPVSLSGNEVTKQTVSRTLSASPKLTARRGSLRRRLSERQLVKYIDRRKSSGRSTPDILEELEEEEVPSDFMLDDLWSDDDGDDSQPVFVNGKMVMQRSLSHSGGMSAPESAFQTSKGVNRSASIKVGFISSGKMSSAVSLENISEEKPERSVSEENLAKAVAATQRGKQKRSSITAEPGQLDNKPNFSDIKELTKVQNQVRRRSSLADFRAPPGFGSRATHFTPIVVSDDKPGLSRAASSPTMDNAKAKARAALKAKLDLKILKRGNKPPAGMLEDLENDALINPLPTPRELEKNTSRRHSTQSLPPELVQIHSSRKISVSSSNSPFVEPNPSRKVSIASTLSDSVFSEDILGSNGRTSTNSNPSENRDVPKEQRLTDCEAMGTESQQPETTHAINIPPEEIARTIIHPKVRTVSRSPITDENSFSPIEPPEVKESTIKPATPKSNQNGKLLSIAHKEQATTANRTIPNGSETNVLQETISNVLNSSSDTMATASMVTSQSTSNNAMNRLSPSIQVNNQTVLPSPSAGVPGNQGLTFGHLSPHHFTHISPTPQGQQFIGQNIPQVIGQNTPQVIGHMSPSQNIPIMNQMPPAQFVNQPNLYANGQMMMVPGGSISPVPQVFNPAMMPAFPYHVQLQADPQTGLYRVVPVGVPIQGMPFHGSNGSLSGNSFGSPGTPSQSQNNTPPDMHIPLNSNNLHHYWSRQKGILDTSSDGDSTCIPLSPESLRRVVVDRKKDQVKKRLEKGKHGTPPTKRSNAKTALSSLIRNPTDSESSESYAFAKPKDGRKPSPQVVKKKHPKGSFSDGDRKDIIKERVRERNEKLKHDVDISRSRSCDRLKSTLQNHRRDSVSKSDTSGKSHEDLTLPNSEIKRTKQNLSKSSFHNEDVDDSRPVELPPATASPASVSSVSHDSGVNMRFSTGMSSGEDMSQVAASQLADALQGHNVVRKVMKLIRHAFAFDGYLENGVEDKEMAEYITSLAKLSWTTFSSAVTEKFCDLFWEEDLLGMLYETINGEKPSKPQQQQQKPTSAHPRRSKPPTKQSSKSHSTKTKPQKPKSTSNSKHPEEDDVLSDLLPDDAFTSTSNRHGRSSVKSSLVADAKLTVSDKSRSPEGSSAKSSRERQRSQSRDKSRSASRDRSKSRVEGKERTPRKDEKKDVSKVDTEHGDDKKMAPAKPKRNPSPGIEPVPRSRSKKHDGKSSEPKAPPRTRTRSQEQTDVNKVKKLHEKEERSNKQTDHSFHDNSDLLLSGLPALNKSSELVSPNVSKSVSKESTPKELTKSQSKESLSSSWSDSQFNSFNTSKSRESLDLNQSQTSFASSSISDVANSFLNESTSSFETSLSASRYKASSSKPLLISLHENRLQHSDSSDSNSPAVKERISSLLQNALSRRDSMVSVSSASSSGTSHFFKTSSPDDSNLSLSASFSTEDSRPGFPNGVAYRSDGGVDPRIAAYTQQLTGAGETQNSIESKIADVEQQLMMERRMRNKTDKFYLKLIEAQQSKGTDHKAMLVKVGKQLAEMTTKIEFLESAKRHLEMLYAEQWGLDFNLLYNFATSMGSEPLHLKESDDNPLLSFHMGRNKHSLQAGEPLGLFSFLFARQALLNGFLHHFFYTYHYFAKSEDLLQFIQDKFSAASGMYDTSQQENRSKILCRAVDILQVWVEGFYEVDFRHNPTLLEQLIIFTTEKIIPVDPQGQNLLQLLDKFQREKASMGGTGWPSIGRKTSVGSPQSSPIKDSLASISPSRLRNNQDSNRGLKMNIKACFTRKESTKRSSEPTYLPASSMNKEGFSLSEHTSLTLAQQLTLIQQELFQRVHPVHYLNSRCKGIGVSTNNNSATTSQSSIALSRNGVFENGEGSGELLNNLFVEQVGDDGIIKVLLDHARGVSHWVSAEIVTSSSSKTQMALLSKFINTAKSCYDVRNFATYVQIMDGLENLIVRQVPAWRILPSKVASIYEDLSSARMLLQGDSDSLVKGEGHRKQPTLPPTLLFLMHAQQLEIGGFQLANGLYKWTKIKSIAKLIDHIRLFQDNLYDYEPDTTFQDLLKQKVAGLNNVDIQVLASQNSSNFHQLSSSKGGGKRLQNAFQRVKANLQH